MEAKEPKSLPLREILNHYGPKLEAVCRPAPRAIFRRVIKEGLWDRQVVCDDFLPFFQVACVRETNGLAEKLDWGQYYVSEATIFGFSVSLGGFTFLKANSSRMVYEVRPFSQWVESDFAPGGILSQIEEGLPAFFETEIKAVALRTELSKNLVAQFSGGNGAYGLPLLVSPDNLPNE